MLSISGSYVSENIIASIINVIIANSALHIYSVHKFYIALKNNFSEQNALVKVGIYTIGELGELLITNSIQGPDDEIITVTELNLAELYKLILEQRSLDSGVKEYILNSIFKLSNKLEFSKNSKENFKELNDTQKTSFDNEVQQRAVEYSLFHVFVKEDLKSLISSHIPVHKTYSENEVKK